MASPIDLPPITVTPGGTAAAASLMASRLARERRVEPAASAIIPSAKCVGSYRQLSLSARHECLRTQLRKTCPIRVG
jgi:hypothetical protein